MQAAYGLMEVTTRDVCRGTGEGVKNGWRASEGKVNLPENQPCAVGLADDFHKSPVILRLFSRHLNYKICHNYLPFWGQAVITKQSCPIRRHYYTP